ncbi:transcription antitermination factor NusB [Rathayibacter sp. YIM 133350]|uniref:RsmB/NOP family class I SAM-dependent RNA methyltransferase n=1 Tax=Rathayibacter sp. YIM 133350 TaxID=3131992 RepID=UPI00307F1FA2
MSASVQPARRIAFEVLSAVDTGDAYANLLLPVRLQRAKLSPADAALATELTYGTLRLRGFYDRVIELTAGRPIEAIDEPVRQALRLGAHQLLSMRVASHAAVNESVELAREHASRSASGFTNGVLRTVARSTLEEWRGAMMAEEGDPDERLALRFAHPAWIVRAFRQALAAEGRADELEALLAADNDAPLVNLVALPGLVDAPSTSALGEPDGYSPVGYRLAGGDPARIMDSTGGRVRVQDEGSQLAALALSRARPVGPGERWLDLCAGPGGKAALLAAEALASGAAFAANELVPARAQLVRSALAAVPGDIEVTETDGTQADRLFPESFDRIMLDAPCTGLGALRRRPEARWRKTPKDVGELSALQARLFDAAVGALKPGGILAYVTCSPHVGETIGIVRGGVERAGGTLVQTDARAVLAGLTRHPLELAGDGLSAQLWPHRHGTDAMFISLFEKLPIA